MSDIIAFPSAIQKVWEVEQERGFFRRMEDLKIFCETQYIPLDENYGIKEEGLCDMEMVYVLNTNLNAATFINKEQHEARGMILGAGGELIARSIPHILPMNSSVRPRIDQGREFRLEEEVDGDMFMIFNYGNRIHITTPTSTTGTDPLSWDHEVSIHEEVKGILAETFKPWHLPFTHADTRDKYVWIFVLRPEGQSHLRMCLVGAINRQLNAEVKSHYLDQYAFAWQFGRPNRQIFRSNEELSAALEKLPPDHTNKIIVDYAMRRALIENPLSVPLRKLDRADRSGKNFEVGIKTIAELVLLADSETLANLRPKYTNLFYIVEDTLEDKLANLDSLWSLVTNSFYPSRKSFAVRALSYENSQFLFLAYDGKIKNWRDALKYISPKRLARWAREEREHGIKHELKKIKQNEEESSTDGSENNEESRLV